MRNFKPFLLEVKNFLFPSDCALCGDSLTGDEARIALCEDCSLFLAPIQGDRCNKCGKPLVSERETCLSCRNGPDHSYERLWTLFPYAGKYRKLLSSYKFEKNLALADFFAEKAVEIIMASPVLKETVVVPVPPRPGKIKMSGWDQVDYLVKRMKKLERENISVSRCLRRGKSKAQKSLNRSQRMENLNGRIFLNGTAPKTALVIDDVTTTGSTLEVCSAVLKENGAEKVYALCLFFD